MAGLGRRTFAAGETLSAGNVMNYLQDQAVMVFAGTASRGSAISTSVSEGMVSYLSDTNRIDVYDGAVWKQVYPSLANAGEIIQVVTGSTTTQVNLSTTTYTDTTLTATITPKFATSKILVTVHQQAYKGSGNASNAFNGRIFRGATNIFQFANALLGTGTAIEFHGLISNAYLDSPATTSATTYKTQFANNVAANQVIAQNNAAPSTIVLMEVAA